MKTFITLLVAPFVLTFTPNLHAQTYVNAAATGNNDGTSWADAYTELATALDNYSAGDEIWVAAGTYLPGQPSAWPGEPKNTFYIHQNVAIYGGFDGMETLLSERDPAANVTTLSGDLNGDDVVDDFETNREDNANNVVFIEAASTTTILDGFTISGGHADGDDSILENVRGGGVFSYGVVEIKNCLVQQNFSDSQGGGLYFRDLATSGSNVENCIFQKNRTANVAGGIGMWDTQSINVVDCEFIQNEADGFGGGVAMAMSSASMSNCNFIENSGGNTGGALMFDNFDATGLEISVSDCNFENNTAVHGGGFVFFSAGGGDCNLLFSGCEFTGNTAISAQAGDFPDGGALEFNYNSGNPTNDTIVVVDCILENNSAERQGGGIAIYNFSSTDNYFEFNSLQFFGNSGDDAGGGFFVGNYGGNNTEVNVIGCDFMDNSANRGGAIMMFNQSGEGNYFSVSGSDFTSNSAASVAGAMGHHTTLNGSNALVSDCTFANNEATAGGGILYQTDGTNTEYTVTNCDFTGNKSTGVLDLEDGGAGVYVFFRSNFVSENNHATIDSCHFENNEAAWHGGGVLVLDQSQNNSMDVLNSTFISNTARFGAGMQSEVEESDHHQIHLSNCDFLENHASDFGGGFRAQCFGTNYQLSHDGCLFDGNISDVDGGGLEIVLWQGGSGEMEITNTDFLNNTSPNQSSGLNFYLQDQASGSLTVNGSLFSGNFNDASGNAEEGAGGFSLLNYGNGIANVDFQSSIFENNSSEDGAGAINLYKISSTTTDTVNIENCLLNGNSGGDFGGGIGLNGKMDLTLTNNTIADNSNGGIIFAGSALKMQNNILHNPGLDNFLASSSSGNVISLGGNLIGDNTMDPLLNNTDQPSTVPMFEPGTYQLSEDSPGVDAGVLPDSPSATDLAGNARLQGSCIDIGAYESPYDANVAECLALTDAREVIAAPSMISVFPNPVGDIVHISIENEWAGELNLRIVNALGQVVRTAEFDKYDQMMVLEFDTSNLPKGLYRALLSNGEAVAVGSFVRM